MKNYSYHLFHIEQLTLSKRSLLEAWTFPKTGYYFIRILSEIRISYSQYSKRLGRGMVVWHFMRLQTRPERVKIQKLF